MSDSYLIEIRMFGKAKYDIKRLILCTGEQFNTQIPRRPVPHITLVGPFEARDENRLIKDFNSVCCNVDLISYVVDGIDVFPDTGVIYLDVQPSDELITFRRNLKNKLDGHCNLSKWDFQEPFKFHTTIVNHVDQEKIRTIKRNIKHDQRYSHLMLRATLLKNGRIVVEYDFLLRRMLNRNEALDRKILANTMELLNSKNGNTRQPYGRTFIISDLHLGHRNIISYCNRPFHSLEDMNYKLVNNWNSTISKHDTVYFLGDLAYGKNSSTDYWLKKLNGHIIFFRGNHDTSNNIKFIDSKIITFGGTKFFLTHNPADVPSNWNDWVIHGHVHNNNGMSMVNYRNKSINVSVEVINYKPVDMRTILRLINTTKNDTSKEQKNEPNVSKSSKQIEKVSTRSIIHHIFTRLFSR